MTPLRKKWVWHAHKYSSKNCSDPTCLRGGLCRQLCSKACKLSSHPQGPLYALMPVLSQFPRKDWNQKEEQALLSSEEPGENFRGWIDVSSLSEQNWARKWEQRIEYRGRPEWPTGAVVVLLNTVLQSHFCEIKLWAFVPNNVVFTFIQQLKKIPDFFPISFLKRLQFPLKFSMLSQLPPVCIRSFTLPKGITGVITQYIQISAFEDIFHNSLS